MQLLKARIALVMLTIILIVVVITWLVVLEDRLLGAVVDFKKYNPTPDVRVGFNAMKNFGRFALIFAVLYWIQVQYGDAEAWFDAFQRN